LLTTFFLNVLYDLTVAIEIGVVLSALLFMKWLADISDKRVHWKGKCGIADDKLMPLLNGPVGIRFQVSVVRFYSQI